MFWSFISSFVIFARQKTTENSSIEVITNILRTLNRSASSIFLHVATTPFAYCTVLDP